MPAGAVFTDNNTQRAIHDAPVDGATTTSISSNWAFDNVKTPVPAGAVFTDNQRTNAEIQALIDAGDYLTSVTWTDVGPSYSAANNGKVLKIVNGQLSWSVDAEGGGGVATSPAGSNSEIQFNNNGVFGSSPTFLFDSASEVLTVGGNIEVGPGNAGFAFIDFKNSNADDNDFRIGQKIDVQGVVHPYTAEIKADGTNLANLEVEGDVISYASSDKRLKNKISNISDPINKIKQINGVNFEWSKDQSVHQGKDVGVIAQEVKEILPEVVEERGDGYLAVKYEKIIPLLIEAIKDQQKQIEELQAKLK